MLGIELLVAESMKISQVTSVTMVLEKGNKTGAPRFQTIFPTATTQAIPGKSCFFLNLPPFLAGEAVVSGPRAELKGLVMSALYTRHHLAYSLGILAQGKHFSSISQSLPLGEARSSKLYPWTPPGELQPFYLNRKNTPESQ